MRWIKTAPFIVQFTYDFMLFVPDHFNAANISPVIFYCQLDFDFQEEGLRCNLFRRLLLLRDEPAHFPEIESRAPVEQ